MQRCCIARKVRHSLIKYVSSRILIIATSLIFTDNSTLFSELEGNTNLEGDTNLEDLDNYPLDLYTLAPSGV